MNRRYRILIVLAVATLLVGVFLVFHPQRPLWMKHEELRVMTSDGIVLAGTLSMPRWTDPVGGIVVVHGSGRLAREHIRGDVRSLVAMGFAVVHYDKRGVGASQGEYMPSASTPMEVLIDRLASDASMMMGALREKMAQYDLNCGFFGASQAGWIIPLAATKSRTIPEFLIILSGTTASTGMEGYYSQLTGDGNGPPTVQDAEEVRRLTLGYDGPPGFDPMPVWAGLRSPTLWLLGDSDASVPTFATVRILEEHVRGGHSEHSIVRYPNAGHDLRDVGTGKPMEIWPRIWEWYRDTAKDTGHAK